MPKSFNQAIFLFTIIFYTLFTYTFTESRALLHSYISNLSRIKLEISFTNSFQILCNFAKGTYVKNKISKTPRHEFLKTAWLLRNKKLFVSNGKRKKNLFRWRY